ncbi:hypothetical protein CMO91_04670 [Candidatus Woesearchaeota archaeon]|nr:hypothetical protein [Candidatus Woesearchaeota archaeon]|tara:strand:+ start:486 stop:995 length:510 start_codon:yes stop_codon:yes gene_type:complete
MRKAPWLLALLGVIPTIKAHCPLCTAGAAVAAGGAAYLGVKPIVIGVFIGAFAVSVGMWFGRWLNKGKLLTLLITLFSYVTTVLPLRPLLKDNGPFTVALAGGYGSLLNTTYVMDYFVFGSVVGGLITWCAPWVSARITQFRGRNIPYQGMVLTFVLLILAGLIVQWLR